MITGKQNNMKFAFIIDSMSYNSYYVKNNTAYNLKTHKPYFDSLVSINANCWNNSMNYPWLFDGHYINWKEYEYKLPDLDLDVIFLTIERCLTREAEHPWIDINNIRKKYPNAKIVGYMKEVWMGGAFDYNDPRHQARIKFLNQCDVVAHNRPVINGRTGSSITDISSEIKVPMYFIAQPHNISYYYKHFGGDKDLAIYAYEPHRMQSKSITGKFAEYIGKKYNIPVVYKTRPTDGGFHTPLHDFVSEWSKCAFHFNLDPIEYYPGNQCTQVASTGCINIGGINDNHHILFPQTSTCDTDILEKMFVTYLNNETARHNAIQYAWQQLHAMFSFDAVRTQIENIKYV
tara:strand:- start:890 stop:1927 length:1038 start_codon:yes stop_codon:yes gene_type:complete